MAKTAVKDKNVYELMHARVVDYNRTFSSASGKKVLEDLMGNYFILRPTFTPGDSHTSAFKEGAREVVLRILSLINTDPGKFLEMAKEVDKNGRRSE